MLRTLILVLTGLIPMENVTMPAELSGPVRLEADGKPIDTEYGHAAPFVCNFDGDGLKDLLVGQFKDGLLWIYRNEGTNSEPKLAAGVMFNPFGKNQPEGLLIAGYAKCERTPEGTFVNYHGQRLESTKERPIGITGTASAAHAADWDTDGDYDLIIGTICGKVYLVPNEGTPESYSFSKEQKLQAGGNPINVQRSAGPFVADWDGDGDLDLLVGADDGSVSLFRNTGDRKSPELASIVQLVPPVDKISPQQAYSDVRRGMRSKICVTDWNQDGLLDLLVGDITYQKPVLPEFTDEQKAEHTRLRNELEKVQKQFRALSKKLYRTDQKQTKEQIEQLEKEHKKVLNRMKELRSKLPAESESHGWVWLFLRKKI